MLPESLAAPSESHNSSSSSERRLYDLRSDVAHIDGSHGGYRAELEGSIGSSFDEEELLLPHDFDDKEEEQRTLRERRIGFLFGPNINFEHMLVDFVRNRTISSDQTTDSEFSREQLAIFQKFQTTPNALSCLLTSIAYSSRLAGDAINAHDLRDTIKTSSPDFSISPPQTHSDTDSDLRQPTIYISHPMPVSSEGGRIAPQSRPPHSASVYPQLRKPPDTSAAYRRLTDPEITQRPDPAMEHSEKDTDMDTLMRQLAELRAENEQLKKIGSDLDTPSGRPEPRFQVFHCIHGSNYLNEPTWEAGQHGTLSLRFTALVPNLDTYLTQRPEIALLIYKDYDDSASKLENDEDSAQSANPSWQSIEFVTADMKAAVEELMSRVPDSGTLFPTFSVNKLMHKPYLPIYCASPYMDKILPELNHVHQPLIRMLHAIVEDCYGHAYKLAKEQFDRGAVSFKTVRFMVRPGQIMVSTTGNAVQAYMATTWPQEYNEVDSESVVHDGHIDDMTDLLALFNCGAQTSKPEFRTRGKRLTYSSFDNDELFSLPNGTHENYERLKHTTRDRKRKRKVRLCDWSVELWCWTYQEGLLQKKEGLRTFRLRFAEEDEELKINDLEIYPLQYASVETRSLLKRRGKTFWRFRSRAFVSYQEDDNMGFSNVDERYMVDMATYKRLHGDVAESAARQIAEKNTGHGDATETSEPPKGNAIYLFPPTIKGYNMRLKRWVDLFVDRISEVKWNDQAFASLVIDPHGKELVEALVGSKLEADKATDLIAGKGNGLIILLHGGPGTGKTFTAEGVAEFARKPLYRVTCGDIGTSPEAVEVYLQSVLHLGKIWDCVVLLDEADVFLEERGQAELQRNALVSVFLRCLEYYDGIIILTSNRVGTFDEAFKSRIQLSLHYEKLTESQRRKIWRNFLNRLRELDRPHVDADDVLDHIDELGKHQLNGREIRNAITTARQLARYNKQIFAYRHLQHVIEVAGRFDMYLKTLREGYSDEQIKRDAGLR